MLKQQISMDLENIQAAARKRETQLLAEVDTVMLDRQRQLDEYIALLDHRWVALTRRLAAESDAKGSQISDETRRLSELPSVPVPELPSFNAASELEGVEALHLVSLSDVPVLGAAAARDHRSKVLAVEVQVAKNELAAQTKRAEQSEARAARLDAALMEAVAQLEAAEAREAQAAGLRADDERARSSLSDALWKKEHDRQRDLAEACPRAPLHFSRPGDSPCGYRAECELSLGGGRCKLSRRRKRRCSLPLS